MFLLKYGTHCSVTLLLGALSFLLLGCGGQEKSKITDSRSLLVEARRAIGKGNTAKALEVLDASIETHPDSWAYLERAKVHATSGNDEAAAADCKAVLEFDPKSLDVSWIQGELKKPVEKRFQGRFEAPPSHSK